MDGIRASAEPEQPRNPTCQECTLTNDEDDASAITPRSNVNDSSLRARRVRRSKHKLNNRNGRASAEQSSSEDEDDPQTILEEMRHDGEAALAAGKELLHDASDKAQKAIKRFWNRTSFHLLPDWLKDNDFLHHHHRPQIESFSECFKSIFSIHSETGNIWTHLIGCILFIVFAIYFFLLHEKFPVGEKWAFAAFFTGAIMCLGFSFLFHTVYCHSEKIGRLFGKLDYCGIALLTLGSFVPWLHFGFYCKENAKAIYIGVISVLAISCIIVSLMDRFSQPEFRAIRAGVFCALGLSGLIPTIHYIAENGWTKSLEEAAVHWLILMGFLYVLGAVMYACRIPERWCPGRCDIWFQSHQIFHVLVVAAALIHYHGVSLMANYRLNLGACPTPERTIMESIQHLGAPFTA
ncbi:Adiponectin receptor protein [Hypsibius exemplaris]|uniref:Adiponectin receptor protein n=1 Tax=Hypsibius exemplaris TaxID=2072580 RepID=A0A9X6RP37_HYPEX|nr:Adiponectin receptor protein [Hypsibius exemplaris]